VSFEALQLTIVKNVQSSREREIEAHWQWVLCPSIKL